MTWGRELPFVMAKRTPNVSSQVLDQAAEWFIDFSEGEVDAAGREEFNAWLRRSPEHVRAYLEVCAFWEDAEILKKQPVDMRALVARAQAEQNVFPLDSGARGEARAEAEARGENDDGARDGAAQGASPEVAQPSRHRRAVALAASVVLAMGIAGGGLWWYDQRETYTTAIGEQRSITLEDGSSIELNSRSRLKVRFRENERRVELLEGQALFTVAKNASRPFVVWSNEAAVRAVGTRFDVYRKPSGTVVTVIEGRVAVVPEHTADGAQDAEPLREEQAPKGSSSAAGAAGATASTGARRELLLSAGEQVVITPIKVGIPKPANVAMVTAWTEQKLVFEATPLVDVVQEFNRYNRQQITIRDPELYNVHVTGVFPSTDSGRMIEFLRQRFDVSVNRAGDEIEIARR